MDKCSQKSKDRHVLKICVPYNIIVNKTSAKDLFYDFLDYTCKKITQSNGTLIQQIVDLKLTLLNTNVIVPVDKANTCRSLQVQMKVFLTICFLIRQIFSQYSDKPYFKANNIE